MEKLIKLLNEFLEEKKSEYRFTEIINDGDFFLTNKTYGINQDGLGYETIISKKFGFIKWLVDNDKIDLNFDKIFSKCRIYTFGKDVSDYEYIIMILSIQDNPIEFLVSILI